MVLIRRFLLTLLKLPAFFISSFAYLLPFTSILSTTELEFPLRTTTRGDTQCWMWVGPRKASFWLRVKFISVPLVEKYFDHDQICNFLTVTILYGERCLSCYHIHCVIPCSALVWSELPLTLQPKTANIPTSRLWLMLVEIKSKELGLLIGVGVVFNATNSFNQPSPTIRIS